MSTLSDLGYSSDSDVVKIDRDDVSNYNPDHVLPESPDTIDQIRKGLQPTRYDLASSEYRKHLAAHTPGTGAWLTSSASYKAWHDGEEHGMLWLKGIPGSGKSVLAAKVADELARGHPGVPVVFFFFRQIIDANHEPVTLLRDWLDQVLVYSPPLQKKLKGYVDGGRELGSVSPGDLWKDLRMAFAGLPGKVFCVADALDEMDQGNRDFLEALASLGDWKPGKVKVLVTSRPVPSVESPLRRAKYLQIRLHEDVVDVDIASYVRISLGRSIIAPADQQLIKEAIPGQANGLFLYAKLAMDAFLKPGADVKEVLRVLPADLADMYTNLLREHADRSGVPDDIQLLILSWVTHATRPLRLLELAEMINITYLSVAERNLKTAKNLIRIACGPLLEILPDETVSVVHHSFTEYLKGMTRSEDAAGYPILQYGPTNTRLGLACLAYMQCGCLDQIKTRDLKKIKLTLEDEKYLSGESHRPYDQDQSNEALETKLNYPFFKYATTNWHVHAARSAASENDAAGVDPSVREFFEHEKRLTAWLKFCWPGGELASIGVTKLHIAAKTGLVHYAKMLLSQGDMDIEAKDSCGKTPLWWAASSGHAQIIRLLVEAGANPDQDESTQGLKPLHVAATKNHPEAVRALLEAGVDPLTKKTRDYSRERFGDGPTSIGHTPLMVSF